jgi:hypothetical protein
MNRVQQNELLVNRVDLASAVMVALPTLCEPVEDQHSFFWVATDSDDIRYYGQSALDCERQFAAELVRLAVCVGNGNAEAVAERWHDSETTDREEMEGWLT